MIRALCFLLFLLAALMTWPLTGIHAQGCGPSNPNCIVPTAPAGTSDNRAASTAFVTNAVGAGTGFVNSYSSSHQIGQVDCGGFAYFTAAQSTITLASASGIKGNCVVWIVNAHTSRGQILSGFPSGYGCGGNCLYPTQATAIAVVSGSWVVQVLPAKWKPSGGITIFVNPGGSDTHDCLGTGSANACSSINTAISRWATDIDCSANGAQITLDAGTHQNDLAGVNMNYATNCGSPNGELQITGTGGSGSVTVVCNAGATCFSAQEPATVQLTGITIETNGNGSIGLFVRQDATVDLNDVAFDAFPLGQQISVTTNAHMNFTGAITINGGSTQFLICNNLSYCSIQGTVTISGNFTYTVFMEALNGAVIDAGTGTTYSGAGAGTGTTGTSCAAQLNGIIHTAGGTIPGNTSTCGAGQTATQGQIVN